MHFYENSKDASALTKIVGKDNAIAKQVSKKDERHMKHEVFEAIDFLVSSARCLYCDEGMKWDDVVSNLTEALAKLKGKEAKLKAMGDDDSDGVEGVPVRG